MSGDFTQVTIDAVDPFSRQTLSSERGVHGAATCTNHSEGTHGRANRNVAGVQSLPRRIAMVIDLLYQKARRFSRPGVDRSARATLDALIRRAKIQQSMSDVTDQCPRNCGWHEICANRFMIPNFPCPRTALDPGLRIDWDRVGIMLELGEFEASHEPIVTEYMGRKWPLTASKHRKSPMPMAEIETECRPGLDAEASIRRLCNELALIFLHVQSMSRTRLSIEFGRFIQSNSTEDLELRAQFQVLIFRQDKSHLSGQPSQTIDGLN
jgi:hypothetical protein